MATPLFDLLLVAAGVTEEVGGGEVASAGVPEEAETDMDTIAKEVVGPGVNEDDADVLLVKLVLVVELAVYVAEGLIVATTVPGDKLKTWDGSEQLQPVSP
jgi:hypothetical protein